MCQFVLLFPWYFFIIDYTSPLLEQIICIGQFIIWSCGRELFIAEQNRFNGHDLDWQYKHGSQVGPLVDRNTQQTVPEVVSK